MHFVVFRIPRVRMVDRVALPAVSLTGPGVGREKLGGSATLLRKADRLRLGQWPWVRLEASYQIPVVSRKPLAEKK